jgi:hypothetical protein
MTIMCQGICQDDGGLDPAVKLAIERQGRQLRRKRPGSGGAHPPQSSFPQNRGLGSNPGLEATYTEHASITSRPGNDEWLVICLWILTLLNWDFRAHDGCDHAVHMIFVAQKAVLARRTVVVTRLAEILFHLTEIG